jgi:transcriptional regulator with XRE-family HTH domain
MDIGNKITQLRKQNSLSQSELAKKLGISRTIVGNYERNENTPSVDVILKMAKLFNVSVDYILGEGKLSTYNKEILNRIEDIESLDLDTQNKLFFLIDNVIQNFKTKQAFAS